MEEIELINTKEIKTIKEKNTLSLKSERKTINSQNDNLDEFNMFVDDDNNNNNNNKNDDKNCKIY